MRLRCVAVVAALPLLAPVTLLPAQDPIRVVRHAPVDTARTGDVITISFDRPVVGSLDRTPDPARIVRVEPAIPVRVQWRDPTTLRIIPNEPLTPGGRYRVTVSNDFTAIDGGRLQAPYEFTLLTRGPRLLTSVPTLYPHYANSLTPNGTLQLVYSAPIDSAVFQRTARIEITQGTGCERRSVPYAIRVQRTIATTDDYTLQYAGGSDGDTASNSFRRLLELQPTSGLPENCVGAIVLPSLDRTPDPARIVRVEPAIPVRVQWHDPTTLRIIPNEPLTPGGRYRVRVSNDFTAIDGGRLQAPYEFTLLTRGPRLLTSVPTLYPQYAN